MKVVMMGLGYIGLPTAALMAARGLQVHGVDVNQSVVNTINQGRIHIVEPDLDGLVHHVVNEGTLKADIAPAKANTYLIAVPTPFVGNYEPDLKYVDSATDMIAPFLEAGALVILESTSPVGTTERMADKIYATRPDLKGKIYVAYCPERVLPGNVIHELENNDRSIGGIDDESTEKAIAFYAHFVKGQLHPTNARTAEMCKLVENSYRDTNIAFANELSMICEKAGISVWELIKLANKHPRVNILVPGTGVGGHCIAVDPWFIVNDFPEDAKIIRTAREVNNYKTDWVIERVVNSALQFELDNGRKPKVACMGLAFKPDIDDLRESPAIHVVDALSEKGLELMIVEPNIETHSKYTLSTTNEGLEKADIIVFLVGHRDFKKLALDNNKIYLDFCGVLET